MQRKIHPQKLARSLIFFVTARFRLPAVPLMLPLAACGALALVDAIRAKHGPALAAYAGVLLLAGVLCWPSWCGRAEAGWVRDYVNLGNTLHRLADKTGAQRSYARALAVRPDDPDANLNMGRLLQGSDPRRALTFLDAARRTVPASPDVLLAMGRTYVATGETNAARRVLEELVASA